MRLKQQQPFGLEQAVIHRYQVLGESRAQIQKSLKLTAGKVAKILKNHQPPTPPTILGETHSSELRKSYDPEELRSRLLRGEETFTALAKEFGLSREWVRQLSLRIGAPSAQERRISKLIATDLEIHARQRLRQEERAKRILRFKRLWALGRTKAEMAQEMEIKEQCVNVYLARYRKLHPSWFPRRNLNLREWLSPEKKEILRSLWSQGLTLKEIGKQLNMSPKRISNIILRLREMEPESFQPRRLSPVA